MVPDGAAPWTLTTVFAYLDAAPCRIPSDRISSV